jgi:chromosome segregation ATPase
MREAELKALENQLAKSEKQQAALQETHQQLKEQLSQLDQARVELDKSIRQDEMKLVEVNFAYQRAKGDYDRTQNEKSKIVEEIEGAEKALEKHTEQVTILTEKHSLALNQAEEHQQRAQSLERNTPTGAG